MTELVTRNFWWPGVTKEIKKYIEGCDAYQRNKNRTEIHRETHAKCSTKEALDLYFSGLYYEIAVNTEI